MNQGGGSLLPEKRHPNHGKRGLGKGTKAVLEKALQNKKTPLEILLMFANDPRQPVDTRINAAKAAAPYVHSRMPQVLEHSGLDGKPITVRWME